MLHGSLLIDMKRKKLVGFRYGKFIDDDFTLPLASSPVAVWPRVRWRGRVN